MFRMLPSLTRLKFKFKGKKHIDVFLCIVDVISFFVKLIA